MRRRTKIILGVTAGMLAVLTAGLFPSVQD